MPTIPIHLPSPSREAISSALPRLLQTPLGYAILELQGTINFPDAQDASSSSTEVGRIVFPDHQPETGDTEGPWMKKVWLYIGYQRMTGSVQKLPKPLAILRRRQPASQKTPNPSGDDMVIDSENSNSQAATTTAQEELEVVEVIKWKIVFRSRPEPVGLSTD